MRFADLLLLAAETINEATPGEDNAPANPEVYTYIDMVRNVRKDWRTGGSYQKYAVSDKTNPQPKVA